MKNKIFALSTLTLALIAASPAWADPAKVIRIGVATVGTGGKPVFGGSSAATAATRGLIEEEFKKDGIKVEWNYFKGAGPAVNEALANKLLDFAWQGDLPAIVAKASGLKTKILLANGTLGTTYLAVPADSPAKKLEDLKGKKVALFKGTNGQLVVNKVLDQYGLTEKDFKLINMDTATTDAAIATKDVDGAWYGSNIFQLVDRGVARIIWSNKEGPISLTRQTHFLVTEDFEKANPEITQRVVNVLVRTAADISKPENADKVLQEWAKSGTPYSSWKKDYNGGADLKRRSSPLLDEFFYNHYRDAVQASLKFKLIRKDFDVNQWFEPKYLNQALKEQKLENFWTAYDAKGNPKGGK
ncbi:ABC transporter substrate-binding protein [Chitinibacter tainanensis]|uniref:ABC transporter substrate-binding protein n=1 Tax=Chitinibacter tainanensis TaxID=230667 RepID=UPI000407E3D4|nr:ABC transporter substrate-binding protein [Chitinibacter tainanensis]